MRTQVFSRNKFSALLLVLLAVAGFSQGALAAKADGLDAKDAELVGERPGAGGPPTKIKLALFLMDIDAIDDASQKFSVDMFFEVSWMDARLALPKRKRDGLIRSVSPDSIWTPKGLITNDRGLSRSLPQVAQVDDDGRVMLRQRLIGNLSADFEFEDFPFDRQYLPIDVISYANYEGDIVFDLEFELTEDEGSFGIEGWEIVPLEPKVSTFEQMGMAKPLPRATFVVGAKRDVGYYLFTMFLPMTLIILMAWSVFWIPPDVIPARISISTAAIFSFVAFGFTIRASLPQVSYMTRADVFVVGCTLLVFIALGVAVAGSRLANSDRMEQALRLSAQARVIYLLLFVMVALAALLY